jgi:hypothetical protein
MRVGGEERKYFSWKTCLVWAKVSCLISVSIFTTGMWTKLWFSFAQEYMLLLRPRSPFNTWYVHKYTTLSLISLTSLMYDNPYRSRYASSLKYNQRIFYKALVFTYVHRYIINCRWRYIRAKQTTRTFDNIALQNQLFFYLGPFSHVNNWNKCCNNWIVCIFDCGR